MPGGVVIIIPSQGDSVNAFEDVALKVNEAMYGGKATIVKATLADGGGKPVVTFATRAGHAFSFDTAHDLRTVMTISHGGNDGPNLALTDAGVDVLLHQPWSANGAGLTAEGTTFWQSVGKVLNADGKVILFGCHMGDSYAGKVAAVTGKRVYAATDSFAAGNAETVLRYVRAIGGRKLPAPLKEFGP